MEQNVGNQIGGSDRAASESGTNSGAYRGEPLLGANSPSWHPWN